MATISPFSCSSFNSNITNTIPKNTPTFKNYLVPLRYTSNTQPHSLFSFQPKHTSFKSFSSLKDSNNETNSPSTSSSSTTTTTTTTTLSEETNNDDDVGKTTSEDSNSDSKKQQQETDWKTDEEFKKFMGNPSIEAAIKLEKKRTDRKLKELDNQTNKNNPIISFFNTLIRDNLIREKERLQKAEETFKALDLNKLKSCFGFDTFFATDVRRFGDGGIFIGNLRRPIDEIIPMLENKLSDAAGREVVVWFMEENKDDITKQLRIGRCMRQEAMVNNSAI